MRRIKQFTELLVAFISGLAVATMILNKSPRSSIAIPTQVPLGLQQSSLSVMLGDSIQLPQAVRLPNTSPETAANNQIGADDKVMESKFHAAKSIARPKAGAMLNQAPAPQMVELPLESEGVGEAPEPEELENTLDITASEEPPAPEIVGNAPALMNK